MSSTTSKIDTPDCRIDLVRMAACSNFKSDFDWINDKEALRVSSDARNRGLTATEIKELAREWISKGNKIKCVTERREPYEQRRHNHYDIVITGLAEFPDGLYVEMELDSTADEPSVNILNAHP